MKDLTKIKKKFSIEEILDLKDKIQLAKIKKTDAIFDLLALSLIAKALYHDELSKEKGFVSIGEEIETLKKKYNAS